MKPTILKEKYLLLIFSILLIGCTRDFPLTQKYSISGNIIDDKTGAPVATGGTIKVDGFNSSAGALDRAWKQDLGWGKIYPGGVFNFSFTVWSNASHYYIYFQYDNNSYINNGSIYLNTVGLDASLFNSGHYVLDIRAAKMTRLRIDFRNIAPYNTDDRLHINFPFPADNILFGYLFPGWENLQFCSLDPASGNIVGGANARGSMTCHVPCDRKFSIQWKTKKNSIEQSFQDSVLCPRDILTVYSLDY